MRGPTNGHITQIRSQASHIRCFRGGYCGYPDKSTTTRTRALREPTAHSAAPTDVAYRIHESLGLQRARVRSLSLRAEDLTPVERAARQLTLDPADERARRIEAADRARARFGPGAVVPGSLAA